MTPTPAKREALIGLSPDDLILYALEITHPDLADAVRVVADGRAREIEGQTYMALAFSVRLARDEERRAPRAELRIDNAGRDIMIWLGSRRRWTGCRYPDPALSGGRRHRRTGSRLGGCIRCAPDQSGSAKRNGDHRL